MRDAPGWTPPTDGFVDMLTATVQSSRDATPSSMGRGIAVLALLLLVGEGAVSFSWAQEPEDGPNLIPRYRMARYHHLAQQFVAEMPMQGLPPRPLPTPVDSLFPSSPSTNSLIATDDRRTFPIEDLHAVSDLERSWFRTQYDDVEWSFLGSSSRLTVLDTARTRELRARLQAHFGAPTRTLAEVDLREWRREPDSSRKDPLQFAYWFVVNDSIPVRVTSVEGPMARGLIVSTARPYRDQLKALRATLLRPLHREKRAPYVDYYYDEGTRRWYRVGFDGDSFFREHISRRDIVRGRRPRLETERSATSPSNSSS
jgi:hypothetical protein